MVHDAKGEWVMRGILPVTAILLAMVVYHTSADETGEMQKIHQNLSVECFNKCWALIDKANRSEEDTENMLLLAHTSLWHWKQRTDCAPVNLSVGYWQVSRVYALTGDAGMAKLFGVKSLHIGREKKLPAFYLGYGYEAVARAEMLSGNTSEALRLIAESRNELEKVTDKEERQVLERDITALEKSIANKTEPNGGH